MRIEGIIKHPVADHWMGGCVMTGHVFITSYQCQPSNISCTLVGNKLVDHSDVVGASPVSAAPTTSACSILHLASMDWAETTARQDEKQLSSGIWCTVYYRFYGTYSSSLLHTDQNKQIPRHWIAMRWSHNISLAIVNKLKPRQNVRQFRRLQFQMHFLEWKHINFS